MNKFLEANIGLVLIGFASLGLTVEATSHRNWVLAIIFGVCLGFLCIALYRNSRSQ